MNRVRRFMLVIFMIIGTLTLEGNAISVASSYTQYSVSDPDGSGSVEYHADQNTYRASNRRGDGLAILAEIYRDGDKYHDKNYQPSHSFSCGVPGDNCGYTAPEDLPDKFCLKIGVGKPGAYTTKNHRCFDLSLRNGDS